MKIHLLGASFTIQTDEAPEYLRQVVSHFEEQVAKVQASSTSEDNLIVAILAGILTTDELHKCREHIARSNQLEDMAQEASQVASQLIHSIDESIEQSRQEY